METAYQRVFEAVLEEPASRLRGGRIRLHTAPGSETDRLTEVGHFLMDAPADPAAAPAIDCFVGAEYRSSRRAIEEAIRGGALVASPPAGTIIADVRLHFFWMTPEAERDTTVRPVTTAAAPGAAPTTGAHHGVSYVPDTDERVIGEHTSFWHGTGFVLFANVVAALAFLTGVALIATSIPHFIGGGGGERPANATPDLVVGMLLLVLPLLYLLTDRAWLMLVVGVILWMLAGGHVAINSQVGPMEVSAAALGLLAGLCALLRGRRRQQIELVE